jgi:hypothetical protein
LIALHFALSLDVLQQRLFDDMLRLFDALALLQL